MGFEEHEVLLNFFPVPAILVDRETGTIRFANAAADRFAGGVFPKDLCHDLLKSAAQGTQLASREARLHLNGVTVPVVLSSSPWSSGVVVTIQDDRGAERVKTRFLSNVSHEFRTPLNAIVGFSELLLGETKRGTLKHKYMQAIRRNGERLSRLISDVLEVSKIDEKESDFGEEPLVPRTMCQAILDEYQDLAREKNLRLQARFDGPCDDASLSDPRRLRRVLTSLLDNALKFTARGFVQLETRVANGRVEFRVSDSGAGIPERLREELFKPFSQADGSSTRRFGGSGLGLELARKTARTMGGDVVLEISAPGKGSRFLFWMPAKPAPVSKARPVPPVAKAKLEGAKILVVEDAPDNRALVGKFLSIAGARVEFAVNGLEGVEKALKKPFDIILMDIQMPELDGYEATAHLRWKNYKGPIIALTAHSLQEERERCFQAGCDEHLMKPVDRGLLIDTLARFLNRDR